MIQRVAYILIGGLLVLAGEFLGRPFAGLAAGSTSGESVRFDRIVARSITIVDEVGRPRINLVASNAGGFIAVLDPNAKIMAGVGSDKFGGTVFVTGSRDDSRGALRVDERGSGLWIAGANGKKRIVLAATPDGGDVSLFGRGESLRAALLALPEGTALSLFGRDGERRAVVAVTPADAGSVATYDANGNESGVVPPY